MLNWLINYAKKHEYSHIGSYMGRFWIVPYRSELLLKWYKNPFGWFLQQFDIAIRIHEIKESDPAQAKHNHPFSYITLILRGGYTEVTEIRDSDGTYLGDRKIIYKKGSILLRRSTFKHRLELLDDSDEITTTLFITFKRDTTWGFFPSPDEYVPHEKYVR